MSKYEASQNKHLQNMANSLYEQLPLFVQENEFELTKSPGTISHDFIWNNEQYKLRIQPAQFKIDGVYKVFFPGKIEQQVGQAIRKLAVENTYETDTGIRILSITLSEMTSLLPVRITDNRVAQALSILTHSSFDILKDDMHLGFSLISALYQEERNGETHFEIILNRMIFNKSEFINQALELKGESM